MAEFSKCKITVIKRALNEDLIEDYVVEKYKEMSLCERFEDGQEFIIDPNFASVPEGFCDWAWGDIRKDITTIASGGTMPWMENPNSTIVGCTDWFRPVYFIIERIE